MENFYVIHGEAKSQVNYECKKIINQLEKNDIIKYNMNETNLSDVILDASTVGMFSNKKIIILEDSFFLTTKKNTCPLEELEQYLQHYNQNNILIFLVYSEKLDTRKKIIKLLSKHKIIEVKKKDTKDLQEYVREKLNQENYQMEDISYFLNCVGSDLYNIDNELEKLLIYRIKEKNITNNDIDKICIGTNEDEIFSLTDAIIKKDTLKSLNLLNIFLNKNYDEMQIIMLLYSQFHFFFQVKRLMNKNKSEYEIAKILETNPYRVKFTVKKLYYYTESMILEYIKKIAKMDHDIKLGLMDKKLVLELFIATNHLD